jgi:hypothetical protein
MSVLTQYALVLIDHYHTAKRIKSKKSNTTVTRQNKQKIMTETNKKVTDYVPGFHTRRDTLPAAEKVRTV